MTRPFVIPDVPHPAVDWSRLEHRDGITHVLVTCQWCRVTRWQPAGLVKYRVLRGTFTGYCYRDRLLTKERRDRLPRPDHPSIEWDVTRLVTTGRQRVTRVRATCPKCRKHRWVPPGAVAAKIRTGRWTGECLACSPNARKREWIVLSPGRRLDPKKGYVRLQLEGVPDPADHRLWYMMKGSRTFVLEHRFVMAKALNRPLSRSELVDHIDGDKTNNDVSNLRLYRRGQGEPGDSSGFGLFYDEWQRAEARIRALEGEIAARRDH
jgi:hypothetical protein